MRPIDHAAAHERIEDLLLEPARLARLDASTEPEDLALREHIVACDACREDLETWRRLGRALGGGLPDSTSAALAAVEPIELPPSLRTRVIGAVHGRAQADAAQASVGAASARGGLPPWLGLAAALMVAVGALAVTVDQASQRAAAESSAAALSNVVAAVDRVLAAEHAIVPLRDANGTDVGSISWSRHDWVVLTTALAEPPGAQRYKCWLEDGERSVLVGEMLFAGETAYWVASVDDWATWEIGPATQFVVTLEAADAQARTGSPILSAHLGS